MIISKITYRVAGIPHKTHEAAIAAVEELQSLSKHPIAVIIYHEVHRIYDEQDKTIYRMDGPEFYVSDCELVTPSQSLAFLAVAPTKGRT